MRRQREAANDNALPIDALMGAHLRLLRVRRGMSQRSLAEKISADIAGIQGFESGAKRISAAALLRIGLALKLDPFDIVARLSASVGARPIHEMTPLGHFMNPTE